MNRDHCLARPLLVTGLLLVAPPAGAQQQPASPHGRLAIPCAECHQPNAWKPARISERFHHDSLGFRLDGAHASAPCGACHQSLDFQAAPTDCASCHRDVHLGELGTACGRCHQSRSFTDHADQLHAHLETRFPLDGPHAAADCRDCHTPAPAGGLTWRNRPTECVACHLNEFQSARNPDHTAAAFPRDCLTCHERTRWAGARFDHATTAYPLTGAHAAATCDACHNNGVFRGHDRTCIACHTADFAVATTPPHQSSGFPTDCTICHTGTVQWHGATYNHAGTSFPLTGAHLAAACNECHGDGIWDGKPAQCVACHRQAFDNTIDPAHGPAGFGTECTSCHNTSGWSGALFDHGRTAFPLTGAHLTVGCDGCHGDNVFAGKPTACVGCHQAQYDAVRVPDHRALSFPTDCTACHTTAGWQGAGFDHSRTQFPLTGAHLAVSCTDCHADGVYDGKPTACVACHRADYDRTVAPPHVSLAFPTECTSCHTTAGWPGASYDHSTTRFPLTGAHLTTSCAQCHGDGVYSGKSTACASCHQADYDATTDPNHRTAQFPTDCAACHSTAGWAGARFDHDGQYFPIYSGKHAGRWSSCSTCHTNATTYAVFTCLTCHEHNQTKMDDTHKSMSGYRYESAACLSCHPRGTKP